MTKQKVGIISDSTTVSKQLYDLINASLASESYTISTLLVNDVHSGTSSFLSKVSHHILNHGFSDFLKRVCFKALCKFEKMVVIRDRNSANFFNKYSLNDFDFDVIKISPTISKNGLFYSYDKTQLEKIKSQGLNLLVRGGSGILRGEIITACPNGIISFHHADNDINRGGPPGFWEVFNRQPRTGFIIQRLKNELDGGDVLYKGFVSTSWMYTLNLVKLYEISNPFLHYVIENITSGNHKLSIQPKKPYGYPLYRVPTIYQQLRYIFKTSCHLLTKVSRKLTFKSHRWGIAYQFTESWKDVTLWRSKRIPNPKNRTLADPFLVKRDGKHYCFVEDCSFLTGRGSISVYEISEDGSKEIGIALAEEFHLSYPYLFEFEGNLYMCPDTSEVQDIRIYKSVEFPLRWELEKILMANVSAADSTIFQKDGKWWLMTNISTSKYADHCSELHVFSSESPLSDKWQPHPQNPVIFDPLKARNGGFISDSDTCYRVYQRQGFDTYGEALGVSKITELTCQNYEEISLFEVESNFIQGAKGVHTYNYADGLLVFDYVKVTSYKN